MEVYNLHTSRSYSLSEPSFEQLDQMKTPAPCCPHRYRFPYLLHTALLPLRLPTPAAASGFSFAWHVTLFRFSYVNSRVVTPLNVARLPWLPEKPLESPAARGRRGVLCGPAS
ncbi:unnamed protein product [Lepidochelys olivacea]